MIQLASGIIQQNKFGQDRISIQHHPDSTTIVLADGSGGVAGGEEAANFITSNLSKKVFPQMAVVLMDEMLGIDSELIQHPAMGESTAILITISGVQFTGVAESKPALGSTGCFPAVFQGDLESSRLLVCSDGLWKYLKKSEIEAALENVSIEVSADELLQKVKLPNGELQDDISFVIAGKERK